MWKDVQHHQLSGKWKSKPPLDITSYQLEWLLSKRQEITSVDEDMEKWEPSCSVGGNENWYSHLENNMEIPQKIKTSTWSSNCTPGYICKETLTWRDTCTPMFTTALFTINKIWKQPKCPSTDKWIKKMCHVHTYTLEYYSVIKKNKTLPFTTTLMDL